MNLFAGQEQRQRHTEGTGGHSRVGEGELNWESSTDVDTRHV